MPDDPKPATSTAVADPPPAADPKPAADPTPAATAPDPAAPHAPAAPAAPAKVVPATYELALPTGSLLNAEDVSAVAQEAKTLRLSQDEAARLLETRSALARQTAEAYERDAKADGQIGGTHFDETVDLARKGFANAAARAGLTPDERDFMLQQFNVGGRGNHKAYLRFFSYIGRQFREDTPVVAGSSATPSTERLADRMYPSTKQART